MTNKKKIVIGAITATVIACIVNKICGKVKKTTYVAEAVDEIPPRKMGFYEKYIKRILDIICALGAIVVFSPIYLVIALLVKLKLGSPVLFTQDRPGLIGEDGKETIFDPRESYSFKGKDSYRYYILIKCPKGLRNMYVHCISSFGDNLVKNKIDCTMIIDVNPYGTL